MRNRGSNMNRRQFIQRGTLAAAALSGAALTTSAIVQAQGFEAGGRVPDDAENFDFLFARICNNNPNWDFGPGGDKNLLEQFSEVLRCKIKSQDNVRDDHPSRGEPEHFNAVVDLSNLDTMRKFPFLFGTGMGSYRPPSGDRLENLQSYIEEGGFLLMDECVHPGRKEDYYQSSADILRHLFRPDQIRPIPEDHEIYSNVYDISEPNFRRWQRRNGSRTSELGSPGNLGVFIGNRLAVFLCDADIHCGWSDPRNSWIKRANHREGIQTGINILTYFLSH